MSNILRFKNKIYILKGSVASGSLSDHSLWEKSCHEQPQGEVLWQVLRAPVHNCMSELEADPPALEKSAKTVAAAELTA